MSNQNQRKKPNSIAAATLIEWNRMEGINLHFNLIMPRDSPVNEFVRPDSVSSVTIN
jgi:hypothetical protein